MLGIERKNPFPCAAEPALNEVNGLARSEAERNKKWFLMPVAPNTKLTLRSQNVMHSDSHF
jgi:hypothetical protein